MSYAKIEPTDHAFESPVRPVVVSLPVFPQHRQYGNKGI